MKIDMSLYRWEPMGLREAYAELTPRAFAVWIRLMMVSDQTLRSGWKPFLRFIKLPPHKGRATIAELVSKGYMLVSGGQGRRSRFIIKKRCRIVGKCTFVRV